MAQHEAALDAGEIGVPRGLDDALARHQSGDRRGLPLADLERR